eukprot:Blabericola_migrator_1__5352@NODE_2743_length_2400_cov_21_424775_g1717_i0_p1_GENE_NODE_2743_length_2400_cov_21_424775_g1717_i0NODE_2743_length_2400_cov_21_424775_g1717_i0_p1_ORF_typecomplete_len605_score116_22Sushi/PF00084_20/0_02ANAPC4_WD40/PF12894_7/1_7e03ANAPC4_WD40/PF12894_7/2e02ANAPC4_WD40/PF12894_7/4_9YL1/PF05764_13/1_1e03YL1/PF05764_13/0_022SDA1/PF05285_12/1_9e03SDA1/PF05285_12/0_015_NODE_2743_length_2400_cov_21_424775_g1717_i01251939
MRILSGDDCGYLKLVDIANRTVAKNAVPSASILKPHRQLAIKSICYSDSQNTHIVLVREKGILEVHNWQAVDKEATRPLVTIAIPKSPLLVHSLHDGSKLLVVCKGGEILQIDMLRLLKLSSIKKHQWPEGSVGYLVPDMKEEGTSDEESVSKNRDWRLRLDQSIYEQVERRELVPSMKHGANKDEKDVKKETKDEVPFTPEALLDFIYQLKIKRELNCASVFLRSGRPYLIVAGDKLPLTVIALGDSLRVDYRAKLGNDILGMNQVMRVRVVGNLDEQYVYSGDHKGIIRVYDLKRRHLSFEFQGTQDTRAVNHITVVSHDLGKKPEFPVRPDIESRCYERRPYDDEEDLEDEEDMKDESDVKEEGDSDATGSDIDEDDSDDEVSEDGDEVGCDEASGKESEEASLTPCEAKKAPSPAPTPETVEVTPDVKDEDIDLAEIAENGRGFKRRRTNENGESVYHLMVADTRGGTYAFTLTLTENVNVIQERKSRRLAQEEIVEHYTSTKIKNKIRPNHKPLIGDMLDVNCTRGTYYYKDRVNVTCKAGFQGVIGCVEVSAMSLDSKWVVFGGLGRRLFVFEKKLRLWNLEHKINVSQKIRSILVAP